MGKLHEKPGELTRREVLKKAGKTTAFVAPVIMSFKIGELQAKASGNIEKLQPNSLDKKPKKNKKH
ncbi:MAG: hypothetical protein ACYC9O_16595 [Candidatus Latescibacterota bacterium]